MSPVVEDIRCDEVLDRMEAFIDVEVDAAESAAIERHLECCDTCAREIEHALESIAALRALPEFEVPARVIDRVRAEIAADNPPRNVAPRRWLAAAAAIVIGVVGTLVVVRDRAEPTDAEALRAAAEVQLALATFGDISRRANRIVRTKVINERPVPQSVRNLARALVSLTSHESNGEPVTAPLKPTPEGSS